MLSTSCRPVQSFFPLSRSSWPWGKGSASKIFYFNQTKLQFCLFKFVLVCFRIFLFKKIVLFILVFYGLFRVFSFLLVSQKWKFFSGFLWFVFRLFWFLWFVFVFFGFYGFFSFRVFCLFWFLWFVSVFFVYMYQIFVSQKLVKKHTSKLK